MKLQKNNKYAKRVTAGLGALVVSLGILTSCSSNNINCIENTEFYISGNEEVIECLSELDIKNKYENVTLNKVGTLVLKDEEGKYRIIQTLEKPDLNNDIVNIYDLFSRNYLCQLSLKDWKNKTRSDFALATNITKDSFSNFCEYFDKKEFVEYGFSDYTMWFTAYHFYELVGKKDINYSEYFNSAVERYHTLYKENSEYTRTSATIGQIADFYATNVPSKFQVSSEEMDFSAKYSKEEKFVENYNISDYEKEERINNLNISDVNKMIYLDEVCTLILKGINGDIKVAQVRGDFSDSQKIPLYDLYSDEYLCTLDLSTVFNLHQTNDGLFTEISETNFEDKSDNIRDYEILEFGRWDYPFGFLKTNIEYLSKKDSIDYVLPDDIYFNIYSENVDYNKSYSIHELASNYVTLVPDDMCFSIKNLENTNDKTLIKK